MSRLGRWLGFGDPKAVYQPEQWQSAGPGLTIANYDSTYSTYLKVYRAQPAVRQVVAFIAENMAQVPLKTYERVSDDERKYLAKHPVNRALLDPNPRTTRYEFMRDLVTDLEIFDVAYAQIVRAGSGEIMLARLFPDSVEHRDVGPLGPDVFRVHRSDGTYQDLSAADVLYIRGYGHDKGVSPLETLRNILAEDHAAGQYREGMYRNGMRNAGVIERPLDAPEWSDAARKRFIEQLVARHTGANSTGRPLLLEEGMTWKSDQISTRSEEYVAGRELTVKAVANLYRVSPQILGLEGAPYASISEYNRQLYQNVLAPRMTHVTQAISQQLLARDERLDKGRYVEFNLEAKLRGSFQEQAAIGQIAVGKPWMTVDEWRAKMELPPLDDEQRAELAPEPVSATQPGPDPSGAAETDAPAPSQDGLALAASADVTRKALDNTYERMRKTHAKGNKIDPHRFARELAQDLKQNATDWHYAQAERLAALTESRA